MQSTNESTSTVWVPIHDGDSWVPDGFVLVIGPDKKRYILPEFMLPDLDLKFNARKRAKEINASNAAGTVSAGSSAFRHILHTYWTLYKNFHSAIKHFDIIGEGNVMFRSVPVSGFLFS